MKIVISVLALSLGLAAPALAQAGRQPVDPAKLEAITKAMWPKTPEGWEKRISFDETQKICSEFRNQLTSDQFEQVRKREIATVKFPADGNVLGDWKAGKRIANDGRGGTFTDQPMTNGANCYACHQMDLDELSYGTLGPSLHRYGRNNNFDPKQARATYAKIYNSMSVSPCSMMPRFGYHGFLTEQQMKDVTALLFDPESPVNK